MHCPGCQKNLDPANHGELVFDGQVWCDQCHAYDARLMELLPFPVLEDWSRRICEAFEQEPVFLERDPAYLPDPSKYWDGRNFLLAEATHASRRIMLHPPGHRLKTLCHELAHLFSGQDHTEYWAWMYAQIVAWVKKQL